MASRGEGVGRLIHRASGKLTLLKDCPSCSCSMNSRKSPSDITSSHRPELENTPSYGETRICNL